MSKKNETARKKRFGALRHMAIAKRITLLYSGLLTLTLLCLSVFMILNISSVQQSAMRRELQNALTEIQEYLDTGKTLSDTTLANLLSGNYVEASVFDFRKDEMYTSTGEMPPFILHPESRPQPEEAPPQTEEQPPDLKEDDLQNEGFQINGKRENQNGNVEYILENDSNQQFMLLTGYYDTADGQYRIQVFRMMENGGYLVWNFVSKMVIADLAGIFCAFLIGRYISRRILQPVEAIRTAAERISIEDLKQRIPTDGPDDEMKELTLTFNSMFDRLETSFRKQNQFISDASHELRTPIAVIQGYANLINRWGRSDPAVLQESIDSILTETDHMSALIRQLLFLAKSDQNHMHAKKDRIVLNEVAAELVREMEVLDVDRRITFLEEDTVEIYADYDLIKQLLWIHGENALKYSGAGGEITVRVWKDKNFAYVSVRDSGIGIAEEDLPHIFDRFYRVDKSRNKEISGTGLGLAIARWIIDAHDGKILVESKQGEGTVFTDRFRLCPCGQKCEKKPAPKAEE